MLKKIFICFALVGFSFSYSNATEDPMTCQGGGPGSTSCSASHQVEGTVMGSGVSTTNTASVTCSTGYYSCCNSGPLGASAVCVSNIPNPS